MKLQTYKNEILYYLGSEQQRCWSACTDAEADLCLCCSHMAQTGFLMMWLIYDFQSRFPGWYGRRRGGGRRSRHKLYTEWWWRLVIVTSLDFKFRQFWNCNFSNWNDSFEIFFWKSTVKNSDTRTSCCNYPKSWTVWFYDRVMRPKDADGMANRVHPDLIALLGAVWYGSTLFA